MTNISKVTTISNHPTSPSPNLESIKKPLLATLTQEVKGPAATLAAEIMQDDFFQAGIGVKSLGYTFLLLKTFCEMEVDMMLSSNEQMKLTSQMYAQLAESERRIAEDTWKSSLAKGISQIAAGAVSIGTYAIGTRAQSNTLKTKQAELQARPVGNKPATPAGSTPGETVHMQGSLNSDPTPAAASTKKSASDPKKKEEVSEIEASKMAHKKAEAQGVFFQILAQSLDKIVGGAGTIVGGYYDAEAKREEAVKHLIQAVISNADAGRQRLQQAYDEAAKQVEQAIQMYSAALQAAH